MTKKEYEVLSEALEKLEESIIMKFDKFNDEMTKLFKPEVCENCDGKGIVTVGEHDDIKDINCPLCNPKESVEDMMR